MTNKEHTIGNCRLFCFIQHIIKDREIVINICKLLGLYSIKNKVNFYLQMRFLIAILFLELDNSFGRLVTRLFVPHILHLYS